MALLTIFSTPKPFSDPHITMIQRNAIQSWLQLGNEVEVLLIGNEAGMQEIAEEFNIRQLPDVLCNASGTPLVSSIFEQAYQASSAPILAYVNADIILLSDFVSAAKSASKQEEHFLIVGQRWDLEVNANMYFSSGWEEHMKTDLQTDGTLHLPAGSDYFIYPRSIFRKLPEFAIGRAGWDNWMIYHAKVEGWQVIDATPSITAIHQAHDYRHLPDGKPHYELPESQHNENLAGGSANLYMVLDSDKELRHGRVTAPKWTAPRTLRQAEVRFTPSDGKRSGWRWSVARQARRIRRKLTGSL